jgi:hypothetical protein
MRGIEEAIKFSQSSNLLLKKFAINGRRQEGIILTTVTLILNIFFVLIFSPIVIMKRLFDSMVMNLVYLSIKSG